MNKIIISIVIGIIFIAGMVGLLTMAQSDKVDAPQPDTTRATTQTDATTKDTTSPTTPDSQSASSVEIKNSAYSPASITVKKGTTVTWTNKDAMQHDVVPDNESSAFKASQLLSKDETYSVTFNEPGTYTYHCTPHPFMKGTVTVTE